AELHQRAGAAADDPDHAADDQPGAEPAVDVLGAVPGAEPDAAEGDPQRGDQRGAVDGIPGGGLRPGSAVVGGCGGQVPAGEAGGFELRNSSRQKGPAIAGPFALRLLPVLFRRAELEGAAGGDRRGDRLETPAVHRLQRFTIEYARRICIDHAGVGYGAIDVDRELDLDA